MTHCYNCGHTGTFVLLVQFALAVPGPEAAGEGRDGPDAVPGERSCDSADAERGPPAAPDGLSLSAQCPACDSTDVGVAADELLARYGATTTS